MLTIQVVYVPSVELNAFIVIVLCIQQFVQMATVSAMAEIVRMADWHTYCVQQYQGKWLVRFFAVQCSDGLREKGVPESVCSGPSAFLFIWHNKNIPFLFFFKLWFAAMCWQ